MVMSQALRAEAPRCCNVASANIGAQGVAMTQAPRPPLHQISRCLLRAVTKSVVHLIVLKSRGNMGLPRSRGPLLQGAGWPSFYAPFEHEPGLAAHR